MWLSYRMRNVYGFSLVGISVSEAIALQFQNHPIRGSEIAPVLRSSESLGYIMKAENTDHAKVQMIST